MGVCGLWGPHCQPCQSSCSGAWVGEAGVETVQTLHFGSFVVKGAVAGGRRGEGCVQLGPWVDKGWDPGHSCKGGLCHQAGRTSGVTGMSSRDKQQTWAQMGPVDTAGGTWRSSADHFTSSGMWEEANPPAERRGCLGAGGTGSVRPRGHGPSIQMWQTWVRPPVHPAPLGLMGWGLARGT